MKKLIFSYSIIQLFNYSVIQLFSYSILRVNQYVKERLIYNS